MKYLSSLSSSSKRNVQSSSSSSSHSGIISAGIGISITAGVAFYIYYSKHLRSKWQEEEENNYSHDTLPSIIEHFQDIKLDVSSTVQEANQRRTVSYYQKAREAHVQSLVLGHQNYDKLMKRRHEELERNLKYYKEGNKSHRTVIVMLDEMTQQILHDARTKILDPLQYSHDINTRGVWISNLNMIPNEDMHVTIAIPWWWHSMRENNTELSQALANRFRQALVLDFHHPFQIELERIILLGGKTLVALWRTIGERTTDDGQSIIQDRHGTNIDPMVRLRREIVECFTTEKDDIGRKPLTYHHHKQSFIQDCEERNDDGKKDTGTPPMNNKKTPSDEKTQEQKPTPSPMTFISDSSLPPIPKPGIIQERAPTIESKTPGLGQGDGFIHTTLCRLPALNCLSMDEVELEPIHRLCREATATYAGHRMIISKFRFLETTGKGGESNPCVAPIFDETMDAPQRVVVDAVSGQVNVLASHHLSNTVHPSIAGGRNSDVSDETTNRHATIGALPDISEGGVGGVEGLFEKPTT